jgi:hypothetical protein
LKDFAGNLKDFVLQDNNKIPGTRLPWCLEIFVMVPSIFESNYFWSVVLLFKSQFSSDCAIELLVLGSKQSEHQNLHLDVICNCVHYGEWFLDISFAMPLSGTNFDLFADWKVQATLCSKCLEWTQCLM